MTFMMILDTRSLKTRGAQTMQRAMQMIEDRYAMHFAFISGPISWPMRWSGFSVKLNLP